MKAIDDGIFIEVHENWFSEKKCQQLPMFAEREKQHKNLRDQTYFYI